MRCLVRNKVSIYYSLYSGEAPDVLDEDGFATGEKDVSSCYSEPTILKANVSPASGTATEEMFGKDISYSKVIVFADTKLPIDEHTVFWIDRKPEDGVHDYIVKRIARSLNSVSVAVDKVNVS